MRPQLILTVTRACDLRCSYCPTAKDGWPSLSIDQAHRALDVFIAQDGGDVKLFGGEPLLVPDVVRSVLDRTSSEPSIERTYLSTNGLGLDTTWLERVRVDRKLILTLSMDGRPADHRRFRKALEGVPDAYDHIVSLLPELLRTPRVVVTMAIPPASARHALENFNHLRALGFHRFNLLPGYYLPWRDEQLADLDGAFADIATVFEEAWKTNGSLYLRNLFTWAPTPFFNAGLIVDADGSIHPSNVGLSGKLDHLREETRAGTLDSPPSAEDLAAAAERTNGLLDRELAPHVLASTHAVDAALTRLVERLMPAYLRKRRRHA
ncbi:MAG: radical SAM protein [Proteobacteria bacterium]|nr:radical SAM protein [Pseudomonadota bacterium]MCP4918817.1 radical SAM protein [Pseudomonadota bacterium]